MAGKAHSVSGGRMSVFELGVEVVLRPLEAVFRVVVVVLVPDVGQTFLVVDGSICAEDFVTFRIRFRTFVQMIENTEQTDNIPYVIRVRECLVKELEHIVEPRLYDPHRMDYAGHRIAKVDDAKPLISPEQPIVILYCDFGFRRIRYRFEQYDNIGLSVLT